MFLEESESLAITLQSEKKGISEPNWSHIKKKITSYFLKQKIHVLAAGVWDFSSVHPQNSSLIA